MTNFECAKKLNLFLLDAFEVTFRCGCKTTIKWIREHCFLSVYCHLKIPFHNVVLYRTNPLMYLRIQIGEGHDILFRDLFIFLFLKQIGRETNGEAESAPLSYRSRRSSKSVNCVYKQKNTYSYFISRGIK